jgi:hypothetical protein
MVRKNFKKRIMGMSRKLGLMSGGISHQRQRNSNNQEVIKAELLPPAFLLPIGRWMFKVIWRQNHQPGRRV